MSDKDLGAELRDAGIDRAEEAADRAIPGWSDQALAVVRVVAQAHREFTAEDVRRKAIALGLPEPANNRAWGGVMRRAHLRGWINPTGVFVSGTDPLCHRAPKRVWQSTLV